MNKIKANSRVESGFGGMRELKIKVKQRNVKFEFN